LEEIFFKKKSQERKRPLPVGFKTRRKIEKIGREGRKDAIRSDVRLKKQESGFLKEAEKNECL